MSERSNDPNFIGQVSLVLGETGKPVGVSDLTARLAERYGYETNEDLVSDIRRAIDSIILCGRASRVASDQYTFF